jgi:hypothetical protein
VRIVSLSLDNTGGTFISLVRFDKAPGQ